MLGGFKAGEAVLILGGASGIGTTATQLAPARQAHELIESGRLIGKVVLSLAHPG